MLFLRVFGLRILTAIVTTTLAFWYLGWLGFLVVLFWIIYAVWTKREDERNYKEALEWLPEWEQEIVKSKLGDPNE